jgi:hypothetical protein
MFLVAAFRESLLWGLAILFLPFAGLVFLIMHWSEARRGFMVQLLGCIIAFAGVGMGFASGAGSLTTAMKQVPRMPEPTSSGSSSGFQRREPEPAVEESESVLREVDDFVGLRLKEVKQKLGLPRGQLVSEGRTIYFYEDFEIESDDGETVARQAYTVDRDEVL